MTNTLPSPASQQATPTQRPRKLLAIAGGFFAFVLIMAAILLINTSNPIVKPIDNAWRELIGQSPDSSLYQTALPMFFQHLGEMLGMLAFLVATIVFFVLGRWRTALYVFTSFLGSALVSQFFKHLVDRERPATEEAHGLWGPLFSVDHGSFPSGHSVTAGVTAIILLALIPAGWHTVRKFWPLVAAFLVFGMMWQRTLINAHWLSDTMSGICLGISCGLLLWWAFYPGLAKEQGRPFWFSKK